MAKQMNTQGKTSSRPRGSFPPPFGACEGGFVRGRVCVREGLCEGGFVLGRICMREGLCERSSPHNSDTTHVENDTSDVLCITMPLFIFVTL